jgi:NAD(P)-dependent dehydrogenase (short-subunit alcohol dehydrogenase family)
MTHTQSNGFWRGKKVLITGGSSGIGKQLATDLVRLGARVGIIGHQPHQLDAAAAELGGGTTSEWSYACAVAKLSEIRAMADAYRAQFGAPDVLVNNAGYALYHAFEQLSAEEIQRLFDVNLTGAALDTRELLPDMIGAGGGEIVMVSSIAGRVPMTPCGAYSAAKHGLTCLSELLRVEVGRFNIRVHTVCPGRVETAFFDHDSFRRRAHRRETERTIPIETVSHAIMESVTRNREFTYVPRYYGLLVWIASAVPLLFHPLWRRLMSARVNALYSTEPKPGGPR